MNAFSLIFSDSFNDERIGELTAKRNLASIPFGGRYRLIDFLLSSPFIIHLNLIVKKYENSLYCLTVFSISYKIKKCK